MLYVVTSYSMAAFQYSLPILKIYSLRDVYYRFYSTGSEYWNTAHVELVHIKYFGYIELVIK